MGFQEPVVRPAVRQFRFALVALVSALQINSAFAAPASPIDFSIANGIANIFSSSQGWHPTQSKIDFASLVAKARRAVENSGGFKGASDDAFKLTADRAAADAYSTTIKFQRTYKGLVVVGQDAIVHFDRSGAIHDVAGKSVTVDVSTEPTVSLETAQKLIDDRAGQAVKLSEAATLTVLKDFAGKTHLAYHLLTSSTASYAGEQIYLDAHTGQVVLAFPRALDADYGDWGDRPEMPNADARGQQQWNSLNQFSGNGGPNTVYSADTEDAHQHVDPSGRPTGINPDWYVKVIEDQSRSDQADQSADNAFRNAAVTYAYYASHFNRHSYDDQDGRLNSIVHVGMKMNNAFWTDEFHVMAYGDGDGEHLMDLSGGVDVGAHELTHGVTGQTARLVYVGESGALNESYSDFFGKMVADDGNWDVGRTIMAPNFNRRALRNMESPEEFKQPAATDSPLMVSTEGPCTKQNDHCGVHTNSGVPNRAAVLIFQALGKEKTESLYYKVLTTRLVATSTFADARRETEQECSQMFGGSDTDECRAVSAAFDAVKM